MDELIANGFTNLVEHYKQSMNVFRPCKPGGEVVEQNLVTAFLMGCLKKAPEAHWGLEIPFVGEKTLPVHNANSGHANDGFDLTSKSILSKKWRNHLDGYIYANETLYLIEAKRDYPATGFLKQIKADYDRLHSKQLALSFHSMLHRPSIYGKPFGNIKQVKAVLLADTWRPTNFKLWEDAFYKPRGHKNAYDLSWLNAMQRRACELGFKSSQSASESYSLLIAQTDELLGSKEIINNGL
ncbi:hypothetical protein CEW91_05305 [Idiomarina piscisalsi]|uniref:Restriction endonuclease n=1 Tax=Idiomarina piscisalsi TaxID=1096243 RepID=A0ABM6LSR4_9GAMM|nr:hypothetical protein [Idiomarina piscisalsi]ASG65587.1 hypothetical protein CEW91_05305 [Idiomarina piscisalsi]